MVFWGLLCKLLPANLPVTDHCTPTWCRSAFPSTWVSRISTVDGGWGAVRWTCAAHIPNCVGLAGLFYMVEPAKASSQQAPPGSRQRSGQLLVTSILYCTSCIPALTPSTLREPAAFPLSNLFITFWSGNVECDSDKGMNCQWWKHQGALGQVLGAMRAPGSALKYPHWFCLL